MQLVSWDFLAKQLGNNFHSKLLEFQGFGTSKIQGTNKTNKQKQNKKQTNKQKQNKMENLGQSCLENRHFSFKKFQWMC